MTTENPKYCVTLVHGTFAPNAPWTMENSVLRNTLKSSLDGPVVFSVPDWGGANSQAVRRKGADKLGRQLAEQSEMYPNAAHFVIAHSHGGNVALMACCSERVAAELKGIVCLATPFLSFAPRRYVLNLSILLAGFSGFLALVLLTLIAEKETVSSIATDHEYATALLGQSYLVVTRWLGEIWSLLVLILIGAGLIWLSLIAGRKIALRIRRLQDRAAERYRTPKEVPFRLLGVSIPFDEARLLLRGLWRVAEIPFWINPLVVGLWSLIGIYVVFNDLQAMLTQLNLQHTASAWIWCTAWGALFLSIMVSFLAFVVQVLMFLSVFVRGHPAGYGWEGFTASWLGRITAREKPPLPDGQCEILKVRQAEIVAEIGQKQALWKLRHSLAYESHTVIRGIADWMKNQLRPPVVKT